ncbi:MAG: DUF418 domain-containing protein [Bacteroidales bacterium]|nr:DUF418 domain-containing protein [Bacteroidales bacterium]
MTTSQQITPKKRIVLIDALRGYALMGLFIVHMIEYYEVYWYKPEPSVYKNITFFLFGGKAYAIFALLFGLSFFIIMDSQKKQGVDFRGRFSWRLCILLMAGLVHGVLYGGDILQILAITGFILIPVYTMRNYLLIGLASFFLLQIPSVIHLLVNLLQEKAISQNPLHWSLMANVHEIYAHGSFKEVVETNLWKGALAKWTFTLESGRLSTITGMSILGFWLGKIGFFKEHSPLKNKYLPGFLITAILTAILLIGKPYIANIINPKQYWMTNAIINSLVDLVFTFATVFGFILLYQWHVGQKVLSLLAPNGRMSLSTYVFQSFVFIPFFYGYGLGAYGWLGQTLSFYLGIVLWIAQVWLAHYWIKRYYYGPLEWLWRSATYLRRDIQFKRPHIT